MQNVYQPAASTAVVVGPFSVVGVMEDGITVVAASCFREDMICDLSIDFAPGVSFLSVIAGL